MRNNQSIARLYLVIETFNTKGSASVSDVLGTVNRPWMFFPKVYGVEIFCGRLLILPKGKYRVGVRLFCRLFQTVVHQRARQIDLMQPVSFPVVKMAYHVIIMRINRLITRDLQDICKQFLKCK